MRGKRKTILLICLAAVLVLLAECQGGEKPLTTVSQALDNAREKAGVETTVMDSEDLDMLLGIQSDEVAEGALYVASKPLQGDMLALFKAANDAAAEHIRQALDNREAQTCAGNGGFLRCLPGKGFKHLLLELFADAAAGICYRKANRDAGLIGRLFFRDGGDGPMKAIVFDRIGKKIG